MPRVFARPRWKDDEVVVAWGALVGDMYTITRGERLRGNDPRVQAHPDMFVNDGTPVAEWPSQVDWEALPKTAEEQQIKILESPSADELCTPIDTILLGDGRTLRKGQLIKRDDPVVLRSPEWFESIPRLLSEGG